jgi:cbb3-type cytochrome oxidase maturation protein
MGVLYILIPTALIVLVISLLAFRWALHDGQFDDLRTPALRILVDDQDKETNR